MAYCTATEAKDNDLSRLVSQAGWLDADVNDRIAEGDGVINSFFGQKGFVPLPFSPVPDLIKRLSILYARYACLRDMHHHFAPSQAGADGYKGYKDQFDALLKQFDEGDLALIDPATGLVLQPSAVSDSMRVQINTEGVDRALTMGAPESQHIRTSEYADPSRLGEDL